MCGESIAILPMSVNEISARMSFHVNAKVLNTAENQIVVLEIKNESTISKAKRWRNT